ncbi:MAG: aspartate kinase [Candidatus Bathyarchaeota archaeon]
MKIVMKFGGTSIGDGEKIRHAAELIEDSIKLGNSLVIVVSAMAGVTNGLIEITQKAVNGDHKIVTDFVEMLVALHKEAVKGAIRKKIVVNQVLLEIDKLIKEFERVLMSVSYLREVTPRSQDYIFSFGEKLSTAIFRAALEDLGLKARDFTGGEAGIVTDEYFGEASPLINMTTHQVRMRLEPLLERGEIPVVTGFVACTQNGITTTLGRGGSDYTATILGSALNVDEIWIWTDVDGLMTADPKIEPQAKTISVISYAEAMEMAYFGAKAMHPRALEPVIDRGIPVRIRNTFSPSKEGTLLVRKQSAGKGTAAKSISVIRGVTLVTVSGAGMIGAPGVAAKVFGILGENRVNVLMISQSSSEANISFIILRRELERASNILELSLLGQGIAKEITSESNVCVIAIVGAGMKGTPGVAAKIFKAVAEEGINIRMIAQGSSELNISFVVTEDEGVNAVRKLHREFQLDSR